MALVLRGDGPLPKAHGPASHAPGRQTGGRADSSPRPIDSAPTSPVPTLILHGTNDTVVSIDEARRLAQRLPAAPHWIEVPDARHTDVVDKGGEELLDRIAAFLAEVTSEPAASQFAMHEAKSGTLPELGSKSKLCWKPVASGSILQLFQRPEHAADELGHAVPSEIRPLAENEHRARGVRKAADVAALATSSAKNSTSWPVATCGRQASP